MAETRTPRRKLVWRIGEVVETRDTPHQEPFPGGARLGRSQSRSARRRQTHCRGWLPGSEELLYSLSTRGSAAHACGRAPRRRRGLAVPDRRAAGRGRAGAARTDRRLVHLGGKGRRTAPPRGRGSGIAPLMAMIRHRAAARSDAPTRLLNSSRSREDAIYAEELDHLSAEDRALEVTHTLTRSQPPGWRGYSRRIDREMLEEVGWPSEERPLVFVCGPTPLVETVATVLVELGHNPARVKTERFGPTGG